MKLFKKIIVVILVLGLIFVSGFVIWGSTPSKPMPEALMSLKSDSAVSVQSGQWLTFEPQSKTPSTGFIIYPGGRVDYRAYAPAAHAIAAQGFLVVIVPMPLNLAVFGINKASEVIAAYPQIQNWFIGGHSLGGSMAADFVYNHPDQIKGLVLWASYPASSNDLSQFNLKVVSISGTMDGLVTPDKIEASRALLPSSTDWVAIVGGDHAQFGWYGPQSGDNPAQVDRASQQQQVVSSTVRLLDSIGN